MNRIAPALRDRPVLIFYILAFTISWSGFVPLIAAGHGIVFFANPRWHATLILMALGPALAAWIVSVSTRAKHSKPYTLGAMYAVPVAWPWWVLAILLPTAMFVVPNLLRRIFQPTSPPTFAPASATGVLFAALYALLANPWEEIGWRGFALRRIQQKHTVAFASLIVGVLWALWHIPLFLWAPGPFSMANVSFWPWAAGITARSVIMAWLFNRTRQSLAIVTIFHISMNFSGAICGVRSELVLEGTHVALAAILFTAQRSLFFRRAQPPA